MKGPGVRIDVDVRREWRCPKCGQVQREPLTVTAVRCGCQRSGIVMKLVGESKSPRIALRPDARAVIDRLMAGEQIPRLVSALTDSGAKSEFELEQGKDRRGGGFANQSGKRERKKEPPQRSRTADKTDVPSAPSEPVEPIERVDDEPFGIVT